MFKIIEISRENNSSYNRIKGIYREFENELLNIRFRLTRIAGIYEILLYSSLSKEKEDAISKNILNNLEYIDV